MVPGKPPSDSDPDVIFYHDSLGKKVNKTLVKREGLFTTKVRAPKLSHVRQPLQSLKKPPKLFLIHVGTNDLPSRDPDDVLVDYYGLVDNIREKFPNSKVVLSAIVTRTDNLKTQNKVDYVNACLTLEYEGHKSVSVCKHPGVLRDMLWTDGLHLLDPGTRKLARELRHGGE